MLITVSLLALATPAQQCAPGTELFVHGTVATTPTPLPAPFDAVSPGDPAILTLAVEGDAVCVAPSGRVGDHAVLACCHLSIAGAPVVLDPAAEPCLLTYDRVTPTGPVIGLQAVAELPAGFGTARVRVDDPGRSAGVAFHEIVDAPVVPASIADPAFAASFELVDGTGAVLATFVVDRLEARSIFQVGGYCSVIPNSTGIAPYIYVSGSSSAAANNLTLATRWLPPASFLYFLVGTVPDFVPNAGGSAGNLCVGGAIGRFVGPGEIRPTGSGRWVALPIDLTALPGPTGFVAVQPGDTWYFSAWYRDVTAASTSNFTNGFQVTFG